MVRLIDSLRRASLPLAVVAVAVLITAWFISSRPQALPKPPEEKIWLVSVTDASPRDVQPEIIAYGEVQAVREAELRSLVDGRLVSIAPAFKAGNRIMAGTELAVVDPVDYEHGLASARADLARAEAELAEFTRELEWERSLEANAGRQLELARRAFERTEKLAATGRESQRARDDAETALASAEQMQLQRSQAVSRLRARVREQQASYEKIQVSLAAAERKLAQTRVVAPFTGDVTDVRLALGQLVGAGERLGRLLSSEELEVRFDIPEADFARLTTPGAGSAEALAGRTLRILWRLGEQTREFEARIARLGAEIDPSLGGIEVYAALGPDAPKAGLRDGAFVEIQIPDRRYTGVWQLPAKSLDSDGSVYMLVEERLVPVPVDIVRDLGDTILVRGGFEPGRPIVARTFPGIGPGLRARPLQ